MTETMKEKRRQKALNFQLIRGRWRNAEAERKELKARARREAVEQEAKRKL